MLYSDVVRSSKDQRWLDLCFLEVWTLSGISGDWSGLALGPRWLNGLNGQWWSDFTSCYRSNWVDYNVGMFEERSFVLILLLKLLYKAHLKLQGRNMQISSNTEITPNTWKRQTKMHKLIKCFCIKAHSLTKNKVFLTLLQVGDTKLSLTQPRWVFEERSLCMSLHICQNL